MPKDLQKGFTLIELMVVVAIIGILAAIALPKMGNIVAERELDGAAKMLAADIRLLQQLSINTNDFDGTFATPVMHLNNSTVPCTYIISQGTTINKKNILPDSVSIASTLKTITFNINGIPVQGYTVTLGSTVINGKYKYVIVAAATGRVRISDTNDVQ